MAVPAVPTKGDIGVRCAVSRSALWFHLNRRIGTDDVQKRGGEGITSFNASDRPFWKELTPLGIRIVQRIIALDGIGSVDLRPTYIAILLRPGYSWEGVLPQVIHIIRWALGRPRAVVYLEPPIDQRVENWHEPLLRQFAA